MADRVVRLAFTIKMKGHPMPLLLPAPFDLTAESAAFLDSLNNQWDQLQNRRAELEAQKQRLDGAPLAELTANHTKKIRENRAAFSELLRDEIAVLSEAEKWPTIFLREREVAARGATVRHQQIVDAEVEKLKKLGYFDIVGQIQLWAIVARLPHVHGAKIEAGRDWRGMNPIPPLTELQRMINEREKQLRLSLAAAA
jgi:hypothetical protein